MTRFLTLLSGRWLHVRPASCAASPCARRTRRLLSGGGIVLLALIAGASPLAAQQARRPAPDFERLPYAPRQTVCYRAPAPLTIDGRPDEAAWLAIPWSEPFVDIQGDPLPRPPLRTRVKMLWDDQYFYVAAEMEEPHLSGTITTRDAVIFQDNDFEVFIDPDGDTHAYYELEINALGTVWDLLLVQPYRDGGPALNAWDIAGLKSGVELRGTLNRADDRDTGWTVEIAMPWAMLREAAAGGKAPVDGDHWRVNFSRVEWHMDIDSADVAGRNIDRGKADSGKPDSGASKAGATASPYRKRLDASTKKPLPEENWVWSPQGAINMHMPERWGIVQFSSLPASAATAASASAAADATRAEGAEGAAGSTGSAGAPAAPNFAAGGDAAATRVASAARGASRAADADAGAVPRGGATFVEDRNDRVKWALRRLYYRQRRHQADHGRYAADLAALDAGSIRVEGLDFKPVLQVTDSLYEIRAAGFDGATVHLRQDGKVWITRPERKP